MVLRVNTWFHTPDEMYSQGKNAVVELKIELLNTNYGTKPKLYSF